jgi:hypothetical protein
VELITAEAGFVVKTKKKENNEKVFINICKAEKIKVASSQTVTHEGQRGKTWDVPFRCSDLPTCTCRPHLLQANRLGLITVLNPVINADEHFQTGLNGTK